jgi:hypothetical protein
LKTLSSQTGGSLTQNQVEKDSSSHSSSTVSSEISTFVAEDEKGDEEFEVDIKPEEDDFTDEKIKLDQSPQTISLKGLDLEKDQDKFSFSCLFTSLDFCTFRNLEPANFLSHSGSTRPIKWLLLKPSGFPAVSAVRHFLRTKGISMEKSLVLYLIAVSSGHWRTIEKLVQHVVTFFPSERDCNDPLARFSVITQSVKTLISLFLLSFLPKKKKKKKKKKKTDKRLLVL